MGKNGAGAVVGYGAPAFNNSGCFTETLPGSGGFAPGSLANCTADTRALVEGTSGFWYKFYNGPKGSFRFGADYAYVTRNAWSGVAAQPHGIDKNDLHVVPLLPAVSSRRSEDWSRVRSGRGTTRLLLNLLRGFPSDILAAGLVRPLLLFQAAALTHLRKT